MRVESGFDGVLEDWEKDGKGFRMEVNGRWVYVKSAQMVGNSVGIRGV